MFPSVSLGEEEYFYQINWKLNNETKKIEDITLQKASTNFGGRNWMVWNAEFKREMIGKMPTEMFFHFFKSFSDSAKANLNIKAEGENEHHKIESIFKAFAKCLKSAVKRDSEKMILPSTKGML